MKKALICAVLAMLTIGVVDLGTANASIGPRGPFCDEFSPGIWTEGGGIALDGFAACSGGTMDSWYGEAKLQYEQNGNWVDATDPPEQKLPPNPATYAGPLGGIVGLDFFWGGLPVHPYSAYNWRAIVSTVDVQTGKVIQVGPTYVLPIGGKCGDCT